MHPNVGPEVAALKQMTVAELRARYAEVFGEATQAGNKTWLIKRIAWRIQALAEGDLSQRARRRAAQLANDADLRLTPPRQGQAQYNGTASRREPLDGRLPPPGTILTRPYKGQTLRVRVLNQGFEHQGTVYPSLSALAKAITGSHINGFLFFRLIPKRGAP